MPSNQNMMLNGLLVTYIEYKGTYIYIHIYIYKEVIEALK